jgi:poly(A) polymerase
MIGRRFRIVHVHHGREIFEVSTFRAAPPKQQEGKVKVIRNDNVYGSAYEDANRRDFTVNGLFLDPIAGEIVDWVGGMQDVEDRVLHSIGDPEIRFREDPVRILRLIKFMRRLDLAPGEAEIAAAERHAQDLAHAAPARLAEEVFRLLSTGQAEGVFEDLQALKILRYVIPELRHWLRHSEANRKALQQRLAALDEMTANGLSADYDFHLAVLFGPVVEQEFDPKQRRGKLKEYPQIAAAVLGEFQQRARLPRVQVSCATNLLLAQLRLDPPDFVSSGNRKRWNAAALMNQQWFPLALSYLKLRLKADDRDLALWQDWHDRFEEHCQAADSI